ncbi:MAG: glycosyltransferase [Sedimentisphaerales bacterium]|nr:glycosyltransferase [Sedimentisphaerales bacterium]
MSQLVEDKATICVVNYKTADFIKLCLRSIRKFTNYPYDVMVIDNGSQDESLDYLKSLKWINLIERDSKDDPNGGYSHTAALQFGLESCRTEFFVSMHSDTFVQKDNWLSNLVRYFDKDESIACVGSDKIEQIPLWRALLKKVTDFKAFRHKLLKLPDPTGKYRHYNRTICCLYRTEVLLNEKLSFLMDRDKGFGTGKKLYFELKDRGYPTVELLASVMRQYVIHLAHATQVVNEQEFKLRKRTVKKCNRLVRKILSSQPAQAIFADDSLDL